MPTLTDDRPATLPTTLGGDLLTAIAGRDPAALTAVLAPDVWFRALVVRDLIEVHTAAATVALFEGWFHRAHDLEVLRLATYPVASREHVSYRFRLRPDWAPETWHVIEQSGYVRVHEGRVRRLDLTCTGFVPA
jgi:hypothetical protein